jgi:hypothetical protein
MISSHQARRTGARAARQNASAPAAGTVIPYDYAATFELTGTPGNLVQDVINIGPEGVFVATAIGYGFEEERGRSLEATLTPAQAAAGFFLPGDLTLGQIPPEALIEGFRVNPDFSNVVFRAGQPVGQRGGATTEELSGQPLSAAVQDGMQHRVLQKLKCRQEISFLFSMVDSATGRELQDEPTHNLASLGISNGERPFRKLAQPLSFLPRSTMRLQVIERSQDTRGTLFIVLYGYKILGATSCPEPMVRALGRTSAVPGSSVPAPERVIPFDYVSTVNLTGRHGNLVESEVPINVEGGFIATAVGYGLAPEQQAVPLRADGQAPGGNVNLATLPLRRFSSNALRDGIRIRRDFLHLAFANPSQLATVPSSLADQIFENMNRPEEVSFRYTFFDGGTGRELQNQPINNLAGLGIATGKRPFKILAAPMNLLPRSTIRIEVQEHFGRGKLFLVFQGYKVLGSTLPGRRP